MTAPTELDIAREIRDGTRQSPARLPGYSLFAMRITGTGASYRSAIDEFVWRDPSIYLNDEFLTRCNGLPVIFDHPEKTMLNSVEFNNRIVGMVVLPYLQADEVWAIARVYDADTLTILDSEVMSTSPGVRLGGSDESRRITLGNGDVLLIEGKPVSLDHLAICEMGVWDKMGEPSGILQTLTGDRPMTEAERKVEEEREDKARKDAIRKDNEAPPWAADAFKAIGDTFGKMMERMDGMEKRFDNARKDSEDEKKAEKEREEKERSDAAKKDADDKAKADAEAVKKDADAHKARLDAVEEAVKKVAAPERSDAEAAEMADAQAKCDSVAMAFGKSARAPLAGESPIAYRRRMASEYKEHSPRWKAVDLAVLPAEALGNAEDDIYKDAAVAARAPSSAPTDSLREIRVPRHGGGYMSEFIGSPNAWMNSFKTPIRMRVSKFVTDQRAA